MVIKRVSNLLNRNHFIGLRIQNRTTNKKKTNKQTKSQKGFKKRKRSSIQKWASYKISNKSQKQNKEMNLPNDSVCAATNRHNRRTIFGGDFEGIPKNVILNVLATVGWKSWKISGVVLTNISHIPRNPLLRNAF